MNTPILRRERLTRLLTLLQRHPEGLSLRTLQRTHALQEWEVLQAESLGWVEIVARKPRVGRPSRVVRILSETQPAKLPPSGRYAPKRISCRRYFFALYCVTDIRCSGPFSLRLTSATDAYLKAFPGARSRNGAAASASRLNKDPMVRAAKYWFQQMGINAIHEEMPETPAEIYRRIAQFPTGR